MWPVITLFIHRFHSLSSQVVRNITNEEFMMMAPSILCFIQLRSLHHIDILCDSMIFGGVIFSTLSAPMVIKPAAVLINVIHYQKCTVFVQCEYIYILSSQELMKLRSADNIYAFVGRFQVCSCQS